MAIFAYLRVSTLKGQTTDNQKKAIEDAGVKVDHFIVEHGVSGGINAAERPAFSKMVSMLKENDVVYCVNIDRLGRSCVDVLNTIEYFKDKKVKLRILSLDSIDILSPVGRLIISLLASVAEMEKNLIAERVVSGLERTKSQGTILGKPNKLNPVELNELLNDISKGIPQTTLTNKYNVSVKTISQFKKEYLNNRNFVIEYEKSFNKRLEQKSVRSLNKDI